MVCMCMDCEGLGRARRFEGTIPGGGAMSDDGASFGGGAMSVGFGGGAISGGGADVLCAEFRAGKEGGGRWSSSSSELSCAASVKVGMTTPFWAPLGDALGVVCGDGVDVEGSSASRSVCPCGSARCSLAGMRGSALPFCDMLGFAPGAEPCAGDKKGRHVDGGWWYMSMDSEIARSETATSMS